MEKGVILKSPETVRKLEFKNHDFVVENYSVRKGIGVGEAISSDEIVVGGHRWFIRLFPVGQDEDAHNQGFTSVSIHLMSETAEAVAVLVDLCIVNQSGKGKHCVMSSFTSKKVRHLNYHCMTGSPRLIRRAELESPTSGYLKDDILKIVGSIGVFTYHTRNQIESNINGVGVDFGKLLELQWVDEFVFFRVEDQTYCAAKSILAARCRALLPHEHGQDDIVIPDVQPQIFMAVLSFIYTGTLRKPVQKDVDDSDPLNLESFAAKLLAAADKFELRKLKKICELSISKKVCRESVASLLCLADVCNAADLKSACLKFAAENQSVIMEADGCELLKETCPLLFLELAGFGDKSSFHDNPSTSRKGVLNTSNKLISTVRESFVWRHWNWSAANTKQKIKEV